MFGRLPGVLIHSRQCCHLGAHDLQMLIDIFGEVLPALEQEVFLCIACGRHLDFDFESQRFADFEDALELLIVTKHRLQGLVVMPDDADEQQADDGEAEPDLLADPELTPNLFHISLLVGERCRFLCGSGVSNSRVFPLPRLGGESGGGENGQGFHDPGCLKLP